MTEATRPSAAAVVGAARIILRRGQTFDTRISGDSMGAAIRDGDRVRIEPVNSSDLRIGDVVAFVKGEEILAHRLMHRVRSARRPERLLTVGDGNCFPDTAFEMDAVLGRIVAIDAGRGWQDVPSAAGRHPLTRLVSRITTSIALVTLKLHGRLRRGPS